MTFANPINPSVDTPRVNHPSVITIVVGAIALAASIAILITQPNANSFAIHVIGYLLTPFVVVGTLSFARHSHLKKSDDPWYDTFKGEKFLKLLQVLTAASFLVGLGHAWFIGVIVSQGL
jgi:hypothetical protein